MPESSAEPRTQYAALPWRSGEAGVEVMLITSRETRRWVIPKGWPIGGIGPAASAAQEAYEEAGVEGSIRKKSLGTYRYEKRLKDGTVRPVSVLVFPLKVKVEHAEWPERPQREVRWASVDEAAELVDEPKLKKLIARFKPRG